MIPIFGKVGAALLSKSKGKIAVGAAIIVVLSAAWVHYSSLRNALKVAQAENTLLAGQLSLKDDHVLKLKAVVDRQNEQVSILTEISAKREEEVRIARKSLEVTRQALLKDIHELRLEIGTTCSDGIALIDRELGL